MKRRPRQERRFGIFANATNESEYDNMSFIGQIPELFKTEPKRSAEPPRRRIPRIKTWSEYRAALARAMDQPGPAGEADRQAAFRFVADQMPGDIAGTYFADMKRGRHSR